MTDPLERGDPRRLEALPVPSGDWDEARWEAYLRGHELRIERFLQDVQAFLARQLAPVFCDDLPQDREAALVAFLSERGWQDPGAFVAWLSADAAVARPPDPLVDGASALAARLSGWGETLPEAQHDASLVTLLVALYDSLSMLGRAARFRQEPGALGGAIACTRRALGHTQVATRALAEVRARLGDDAEARVLADALHEHRNAVALRVLALREEAGAGEA